MNKLNHLALSFAGLAVVVVFSTPCSAQTTNLNFGQGSSLQVTPNGTTFNFGGNVQGSSYSGATGYQQSSGTQGDMGFMHDSGPTPGELTDSDRSVHNYQGFTRAEQNPIVRPTAGAGPGGLPMARYTIDALQGSYGGMFGMTQIPSGQFKYGFSRGGYKPFLGASWARPNPNMPFSIGNPLPPTSTSSVDINTVDCPFIRKP
ncbi:MAG TPA: hypothetical protein V6D17_15910 [Candidatus Obscuribacterales bacterium]